METNLNEKTDTHANDTCTCHSHSACGCGCHCHEEKENSIRDFVMPTLSFCLLIAGIIMNHTGTSWFSVQSVKLIWFLVAFLPVGLPVIQEAWEAVREKDFFSEFTLMLIASIGAFCIGEYPEAVAVMLFYTIGETLQHRAVDKASRNISRLLDVRPERTSVLRNGNYTDISPKEVRTGEQIEIKPGERIPLDGVLTEEEATFDTSALTGESIPRTIAKGGEVLAGMISAGQTVHLQVVRPYESSTLARILALVKDASERKAPAELFIRRFARVYTPIVIALALCIIAVPALISFFSPSFDYVFADWLYRGLVFLVISCPCALVISVPLGYFAGIGAASRAGILFKGGNYLDAITHVSSIAFDKTGTLTSGKFQVTHVACEGMTEEELLSIVAAVESKSTHPIAQAIVEYANQRGTVSAPAESMHEMPGYGAEAVVNGKKIQVGNVRLFEKEHIQISGKLSDNTGTTVICTVDGKYAGMLTLSDELKEDASAAIDRLKNMGINDLILLSGDKKEIVEEYAHRLGIEKAYGELLPEDKARYVEEKAKQPGQSVAFVGDGMNDAPVLALSNVGIAMGGWGSDAAIESADVVIQTDQPSKVATAIRIGRTTRAIVRQNIVGAISIKVIIMAAGVLGYASMWGAVFADVGVALLAVLNSVRIMGKKFE